MRDHSLQEVPERLAVQGEVLVSYRFRTGSVGLASPGEHCRIQGCLAGNRRTPIVVVVVEAQDQPSS